MVSVSIRIHAAKLLSVRSVTNVHDNLWQGRAESAFKSIERRHFARKNLDRPRAIDARFRASNLGLAQSRSRENDEPAVRSLVELQGMTATLEVALVRVEAMHDAAVCVSLGGFACSRDDVGSGEPRLGRFEPCDHRLDSVQDSSPASLFQVVCFA